MTKQKSYANYRGHTSAEVMTELIAGAVTGVALGRRRAHQTFLLIALFTAFVAFAAGVMLSSRFTELTTLAKPEPTPYRFLPAATPKPVKERRNNKPSNQPKAADEWPVTAETR